MCTINYDIISSSLPKSKPDPFLFSSYKPHLPPTHVIFPTRVGSTRLRASRPENSVTAPLSNLSFYELLGISETGSLVDIKQAYKQLARKYHPDVSPPGLIQEYTERFIRVQEAYETLSDPGRRAMYDENLAKGIHFAFSARKNYQNNEKMDRREWKNRWQSQLSHLKMRSMYRESQETMSWGERMRRQKNESAS
ncbi:chaperone protein dnaJ 20, chloroplastic [Apium graveolens]|uniref:chaperone protein dnaJ 20, chloroplastic n=1 Tax=Apium graveolens TaxID=4045 RepID=UPI003D7A119A